jgi:hypothetical protein
LLAGATDIDAVELNRHIIDAVSRRFGRLSGDIYNVEGVHAVANEGRSHLTHTKKSFDLIQISLIDSWAASVAGAFALAENNLYTVEAFGLYLRRLSDDGMISTSRWLSEMPRLIILVRAALEAAGVADAPRHMAIVSAQDIATLLLSKKPFTSDELGRLRQICARRGFSLNHPVRPDATKRDDPLVGLIHGDLAPMARLGLNTDPPTDNSPYFFHLASPFTDLTKLNVSLRSLRGVLDMNLDATVVLQQAMVAVVLLAVVFFMLPFGFRLSERGHAVSRGSLARGSTYFAAIGCGFMLMENMLVQHCVLYLGHPSYATTVILASLLAGMGVGSISATRIGLDRLRRLGLVVPLAMILLATALGRLFGDTLGLPLALRVGLSLVVLVPLGGALGLFFPLGMLRFGDEAKPWYWAINGVFGVAASVMSLSLSMEFGFVVVGAVSAAAYIVAWICLLGREETGEASAPCSTC